MSILIDTNILFYIIRASLAALLGLKLVTTDSDLDHLDHVFFEIDKLKPIDFTPFF